MAQQLSKSQWETLVYAPLWVYTAVARADGAPEPSQFRRLVEELGASGGELAGSTVASTALETLVANLDPLWSSFEAAGVDPRRGLTRTRGTMRRLPPDEAQLLIRWLIDLAVRIGGARYVAGEARLSELEGQAIRNVASWLGVEPPDLTSLTG